MATDDRIVIAFTDPVDTDPPETRYRYFTDEFTGEGVHTRYTCFGVEAFINRWIQLYDKPNGMWYWVLDNGKCICSGACDPDDIDIFIEHWHLEEYSDDIYKSMKTKEWVSLNCKKENKTMATVSTKKTKETLLNELEAKNTEIKELKKELEKVERYKQYEETAGELAALRDSFVNAGFTKAEANDLLKVAMNGAFKSGLVK